MEREIPARGLIKTVTVVMAQSSLVMTCLVAAQILTFLHFSPPTLAHPHLSRSFLPSCSPSYSPSSPAMPPFTSLVIPALYQSSRQFAPRSLALIRQAQYLSTKAGQKPDVVTYEEIDGLVRTKDRVGSIKPQTRSSFGIQGRDTEPPSIFLCMTLTFRYGFPVLERCTDRCPGVNRGCSRCDPNLASRPIGEHSGSIGFA
jgi:hypothetical protein